MARENNISSLALPALLSLLAMMITFVFYNSPLRETIEAKLYDYRCRAAPGNSIPDSVIVAGIDLQVLDQLGRNGPDKLPAPALVKLARAALSAGPKAVAVLLHGPYDDPGLAELAALSKSDPRLYLGVYDLGSSSNFANAIPPDLRAAEGQIFAADVQTYFNDRAARSLPLIDLDMQHDSHFLLPRLAGLYERERIDKLFGRDGVKHIIGDEQSLHFRLNYFHPSHVKRMPATDLLDSNKLKNITGKYVLIGYTNYIKRRPSNPLPTYVNTPWQGDGSDLSGGVPSVVLSAIGLENLLDYRWLRLAPTPIAFIQTILVCAGAFFAWWLPVSAAVLIYLGGWLLLIFVHGVLFSHAALFIPLSDTMVLSALATIGGSLWRVRQEGHLRAIHAAKASSEREIGQMQDQFLNRLASELSTLNSKILTLLHAHQQDFPPTTTIGQAYVKAKGSAEELREFLAGIEQFSGLARQHLREMPVRREAVDVRSVLERIIARFESRLIETQVRVELAVEAGTIVHTDEILLEQILYNFVSNAIKYSPKQSLVRILQRTEGNHVVVSIIDQGPGIPDELQEKIFEKFYRIKNDMVYKIKGHGLGLYLSRYFAELLGASIRVKSEPGLGSEFQLLIPGGR